MSEVVKEVCCECGGLDYIFTRSWDYYGDLIEQLCRPCHLALYREED